MSHDDAAPLVLILEDDRRSASALEGLISDWGYRSVHGEDLESVITELAGRESEVSAIISDFHLRGGDIGVEAITVLRKRGVTAPALLLTGTLRGKARRDAEAAGHAFLEKPVHPERLEAWLRQSAPSNLAGGA